MWAERYIFCPIASRALPRHPAGMDAPNLLNMPTGDLVLIYSDGTLLFVEPVSEVFEPHKFGAKAN